MLVNVDKNYLFWTLPPVFSKFIVADWFSAKKERRITNGF